MVKIENCDLFEATAESIIHQVNCRGVMGSGVAKEIKRRYPETFLKYKNVCMDNHERLLGEVLLTKESDKFIFNAFGQNFYGVDRVYTDYNAVKSCLYKVRQKCEELNIKSVACPYLIGCGLGGGNEKLIMGIISEVFTSSNIEFILCKK